MMHAHAGTPCQPAGMTHVIQKSQALHGPDFLREFHDIQHEDRSSFEFQSGWVTWSADCALET